MTYFTLLKIGLGNNNALIIRHYVKSK